ncbi:MAG: hypothetical protein AB7K04_17870 [Pseudorhodoplanes sp.]
MSNLAFKAFRLTVVATAVFALLMLAMLAGALLAVSSIFTDGLGYFLAALLIIVTGLVAIIVWAEREPPSRETWGTVAAVVAMVLVVAITAGLL